jgi:hypothetical protein
VKLRIRQLYLTKLEILEEVLHNSKNPTVKIMHKVNSTTIRRKRISQQKTLEKNHKKATPSQPVPSKQPIH